MSLDNCIFGWVLFKEIDIPIAHHTGIIIKWTPEDPWKSMVAHYGSDYTSRVLIETLKDAVVRSEVYTVRINPHYNATFRDDPPYLIDDNGHIIPSDEILLFEETHPEYNVISSNCQHFVKTFVGNIAIESDLFNHITPIFQNLMRKVVFGGQKEVNEVFSTVMQSYDQHRQTGICAWEPSLDLDVPDF